MHEETSWKAFEKVFEFLAGPTLDLNSACEKLLMRSFYPHAHFVDSVSSPCERRAVTPVFVHASSEHS